MNRKGTVCTGDILIAVDIQNDFCHGGSLAVPHADEIMPAVNRIASLFSHVILTQDWHPKNHLSFASSHPGAHPYETIALPYGSQTLWPDHCVQGTVGADLHNDLKIAGAELILRKGYHREIDSYSAFYENDRTTPTGLTGYLKQRGFARVFLAGLAFDYCIRFSAEDARKDGFDVIIIEDACRSIAIDSDSAARWTLSKIGATLLTADELRES
jgi:nicotinamidase/pyrazinamidase